MAIRWIVLAAACVVMFASTPVHRAVAAPADIQFPARETVTDIPPAVFPHWFHRIRFKCAVCHTKIFPMEITGPEITMDAISAGQYCGACHNSETAWSVTFDKCPVCHVQQ